LIRIDKDPPDRVVSIYHGILAYMYLYRALHPNQSIIFLAIFAFNQYTHFPLVKLITLVQT